MSGGAFGYRVTKDGMVFVSWQGKTVATFTGQRAARLLAKLEATDAAGVQLALAKATGNFKRGNEKAGRR